ncbi:adenosine monophosphate-protein transferase [Pseudothermotoga hypogea DSM 11164 = NBRC 106472]|uniref:Adenosine monophosphate-protein transferase n=2 Tax=Pseudothermotoga hypogea TaxID=57487 RepID=A0A0X1KRY6_9THEM|nr:MULTISPECIES: adenosine-specific kinase [Pseudothermotoga]AJC74042.1 adenosine monophosphate-protein transferase [Pseudothermotoga hypogea DSM 11164 = NBRC 106472]MBC7122292.1 adenosine-specific kinase [Pseudothermotoga sp.]MDI6863062.1 adenosine-specific kinase [Pseudothermotoga sp.]
MNIEVVQLNIPEGTNVILGHSHFIKTVEDLYEVVVTTNPNMKFGLAFNEASGPCLVRYEGNDQELIDVAIDNARRIGAGHLFVLLIRNGYPINILNQIKNVQEVCRIFAATANPLQVLVVQTDQGRSVIGVVDGFAVKGVESDKDREWRHNFLRQITKYKK